MTATDSRCHYQSTSISTSHLTSFSSSDDHDINVKFDAIQSIKRNSEVTKHCDEDIFVLGIMGTLESDLFIAEAHSQGADEEVIAAGTAC